MQKKSFLTPLGLVRQYDSPNPYCSPSIIIQGNFHLSKHPREWFDRFFKQFRYHNESLDHIFQNVRTWFCDYESKYLTHKRMFKFRTKYSKLFQILKTTYKWSRMFCWTLCIINRTTTGCPNKHGNSVTNSISSLWIILWFSIVIPTEKAVICKIFVCYVYNLFVYVLTAYGCTYNYTCRVNLSVFIVNLAETL